MNKIEQLFEQIKKIRLEQKEYEQTRNFLLSFMESRPLTVSKALNERHYGQRSNIFRAYLINFYRKPMLTLIITLIIALSGGVSAAAENSLPGDFLFPVKVKVNEEIRSAITFTPRAKAQWEIKLVERRLEEAEKLAAKGELKTDVRAQIEQNFKTHADRVQERILKFEAEDKAEISSNFETSLKAHEAILEKLLSQVQNGRAELKKLEIKVEIEAEETEDIREESEAKVKIEAAAQGKLNSAENKIEEVEKFIQKMEARLGAQATAEAKTRLEVAKNTVVDGKAKLNVGNFSEAFILFQKAHRIAQEAKLLIEAQEELDLDVNVKMKIDREDEDEDEDENKTKIEIKGGGGGKLEIKTQ